MWGVSFGSAIRSLENLPELFDHDISFIELPARERAFLDPIYSVVTARGMLASLHLPSPELAQANKYIYDTKTSVEVVKYLELLEPFFAFPYQLEYIVVHYPLITKTVDIGTASLLNSQFLHGLSRLSACYGRKLFLENIAGHPVFCTAEHIQQALLRTDGYCFDLGHAHTACVVYPQVSRDQVWENFNRNGKAMRAIHLYNTTNLLGGKYQYNVHYPLIKSFSSYPGFMSYETIIKKIKELPSLSYVIFEPQREAYLSAKSFGDFF